VTRHEKYDPLVEIEPIKEIPEGWDEKELEPAVFVLAHPIKLKGIHKTYYWPARTVILGLGRAEKEGEA